MPETIPVLFTRAEYEALMDHLRESVTTRDAHYLHAPTLAHADLLFALRTLEAAGRTREAA